MFVLPATTKMTSLSYDAMKQCYVLLQCYIYIYIYNYNYNCMLYYATYRRTAVP